MKGGNKMPGRVIGIDLGTANTVICTANKGIIINQPAVAAINKKLEKIIAIGEKALQMSGKNHDGIAIEFPLSNGVISNGSLTGQMLLSYLHKICKNDVVKPSVIVSIPSSVTSVEQRSIIEVAMQAGARRVALMEEPLAAAIGAGADILKPKGVMVVDIGGGTTDIALITMGEVLISRSVKSAGTHFNEAIIKYIRQKCNIIIGDQMAETIKKRIGCAEIISNELAVVAKGQSFTSGLPVNFEVTSTDVAVALRDNIFEIVNLIVSVLSKTPPELSGDILSDGIILTGGGALLGRMAEVIEKKTRCRVKVAKEPLFCVANGLRQSLKQPSNLFKAQQIKNLPKSLKYGSFQS
jgi:rod shape-determining protein MreB